MTEVLLTNIFFAITATAVIVTTVMVCVLLFYVIKAVRSFQDLIDRAEAGGDMLAEDWQEIKANLNPAGILNLVVRMLPAAKPARRTRRTARKTEE